MAASKKYGRIRNARQNVVPLRAFFLVVIGAAIMKVALAGSVRDIQNFSCMGAQSALAMIEQNYEHRYHHYVIGGEDALQELVKAHLMRALPECRAGGHYSAVANPDGSVTIRCSLPEHDLDHGVTRSRLRHRP